MSGLAIEWYKLDGQLGHQVSLFHMKPLCDAGPPGPSNERLYVKPDLVVGV
ncbi:hypothetical protein PCANC_15902 [Puccinia coronata f. sp. avenae]|uniref:Uncharacterized protein n=1 Tax=Puccinia coronata f. sp. avenae TaxID=200324 RepID=A0A2N5UMB0_9BASI|nr:hypothetical protein PCASD_15061 [Puccinia coronata f. sp. avenae]PLW38903.1 hypothetical protein PCANC_15902 [Puccinia coronata f. sp. avenae]